MAIEWWYADFRQVTDETEYKRLFDLLDTLAGDCGGNVHRAGENKVFRCLLDAEENAALLRGLAQYLSRRPPETS